MALHNTRHTGVRNSAFTKEAWDKCFCVIMLSPSQHHHSWSLHRISQPYPFGQAVMGKWSVFLFAFCMHTFATGPLSSSLSAASSDFIHWTHYPDKTKRKLLYEAPFLLEACGWLDTELLSFGSVLPIIWKSLCISSQQALWSLLRGSSEGHIGLRCHGEIKLAPQLTRVPNYCLLRAHKHPRSCGSGSCQKDQQQLRSLKNAPCDAGPKGSHRGKINVTYKG